MGGERDRGRPRRGALVRAIPLSPMGIKEKSPPLSDKKERGLFIVFILYLTCKSIDLEW